MATHHGLPGHTLALLLVGRVVGIEADGGGVDEELGTGKGHETGCLGIPLVPADKDAKTAYGGLDGLEAEVTRGEVELLVIAGVVGDMHLAVFAGNGAVFLEDNGGVMVETGGTALEKGGDEHDAAFLGYAAIDVGGGTWDGLGQVEEVDILYLTEIEGVVELLQNNEFCTALGEVTDAIAEALDIVDNIGCVVLLKKSYFHTFYFLGLL